ncbi:MAG: hypothetical protein V4548_01340 [Bacteroidota bacterium]
MKNFICFLLLIMICISCDQKFRDDLFSPEITKIEIQDNGNRKIYTAEKTQQIEEYKNLLQNSEQTDYCCCPEENISISLFANNDNFNTFYVDTIEFKDKVRIFQVSYQYSYIIKKKSWENFLNKRKN